MWLFLIEVWKLLVSYSVSADLVLIFESFMGTALQSLLDWHTSIFLFFRDLDDVAAVEPVATLGGEVPQDSLTKEEKKKQKKKQQKVTSAILLLLYTQCLLAWRFTSLPTLALVKYF